MPAAREIHIVNREDLHDAPLQNALDGMDVPSASRRIAATIAHLNPTSAQLREFTSDIADSIMGSAAGINHSIGGREVVVEHDDDRLDVLIDGRAAASFSTSRVALTGYPLPQEPARGNSAAAIVDAITVETMQQAREVVGAVIDETQPPALEPAPGFENVVAGAVIVLDRHASPELGGSDWMRNGEAGRATLNTSVARMIEDIARPGAGPFQPGKAIETLVSDVLILADAQVTDPFFPPIDRDTDPRRDVHLASEGRYDGVAVEGRQQIGRALATGADLPLEMQTDIAEVAKLVERERQRARIDIKVSAERLADFREYGIPPLFNPVTTSHYARVAELEGGAQPMTAADAAVAVHISSARRDRDETVDERARAQALADFADEAAPVGVIARRIEAHAIQIQRAVDEPPRWSADRKVECENAQRLATSHPGHMTTNAQVKLYSDISRGEGVGTLAAMRMMIAGARAEAELVARTSTREQAVARPSVLAGIVQAAVSRGR